MERIDTHESKVVYLIANIPTFIAMFWCPPDSEGGQPKSDTCGQGEGGVKICTKIPDILFEWLVVRA